MLAAAVLILAIVWLGSRRGECVDAVVCLHWMRYCMVTVISP